MARWLARTDAMRAKRTRRPRRPKVVVLSCVHRAIDSRIFYRQAVYALSAGYRVVVIARHKGEEVRDGVRIHPFKKRRSRFLRFLSTWKLALMALKERADLYHFHDPEMLPAMVALRIARGRPVIYDCHEHVVDSLVEKRWIPAPVAGILKPVVFAVQWLCAKVLGKVIVVVQEQKGMFPESVDFLVLGNFPPRFATNEAPDPADRPYDLVHCGSVSRQRGSLVLVETIRILVREMGRSDLTVLMIGHTPESVDREFLEALRCEGLERHVAFGGYVPLDRVPHELRRAKIGLAMQQRTRQYRYAITSKLLDYMAAGLPSVSSDFDYNRKYAPENEAALYVDPCSATEFAGAISSLLDDHATRERMGKKARRLQTGRYTAEGEVAKLLAYYGRALGFAGSSPCRETGSI